MRLNGCNRALLLWASSGLLLLGLVVLTFTRSPVAFANPGDLFVMQGGMSSDCTQASPCALATAMTKAVTGDTIYVAAGNYKGAGAAVITVTASITLYGGWNGIASGSVVRNPALYPSVLDGQWARRVVYISGNITPTLDGFTITRGNAAGLVTNCPTPSDGCGGGIFVLNAHPIIANNIITDNVAALTSSGFTGSGGGLYLNTATGAVISGNIVISNAGGTANQGAGGGIWVWGDANGTQITSNQVISNSATTGDFFGYAGGIYIGPGGGLIQDNIVEDNRTNSTGTGAGAGIRQYSGNAQFVGNLIRGNRGGYAVELVYSRASFEGNRVVDNATDEGVVLQNGSGHGATLVNNIIARSGGRTLSIYGNNATDLITATLLHNTLVGSGTGYGVFTSFADVYITNTIVVSHSWGITNTTSASSTVMADHTLFWGNSTDGIRGSSPVDGDPAFVNPATADFHLGAGSAAIDAGIATWVATDIDGDPRPVGSGYDIGADERIAYRSLLPLLFKP